MKNHLWETWKHNKTNNKISWYRWYHNYCDVYNILFYSTLIYEKFYSENNH